MKYSEYINEVIKSILNSSGSSYFICNNNELVLIKELDYSFTDEEKIILHAHYSRLAKYVHKKLQQQAILSGRPKSDVRLALNAIFGFNVSRDVTSEQRKNARIKLLTNLAKYHAARGN